MKTVIARSFVIALVVGLVATTVATVLTATFHESAQALGTGRVLIGLEAVKAAIEAFGFWSYAKGLGASFVLFFASVFLGAIWQGIWASARTSV